MGQEFAQFPGGMEFRYPGPVALFAGLKDDALPALHLRLFRGFVDYMLRTEQPDCLNPQLCGLLQNEVHSLALEQGLPQVKTDLWLGVKGMFDDGCGNPVLENAFNAGLISGAGSVKKSKGITGAKPEDGPEMVGLRACQLRGFSRDICRVYEKTAEAHGWLWPVEKKSAPFSFTPGLLMFQAKGVIGGADTIGLGPGQNSCQDEFAI